MVLFAPLANRACIRVSVALLSLILTQFSYVFGADEAPITKIYDDSYIMSRVQLVGVIAGGRSETAGIAVIKDIHSGRSYAVKTGDVLPGVGHIVLTKVQREVAVFKANDREYFVRVSIGSAPDSLAPPTATVVSEGGSESEQTADGKGPGLFEKWAAGAIERGADLISLDKIKNKKATLTSPVPLTGSIDATDVRVAADQDQSEENIVVEDDIDDAGSSL